MKSGTFGGKMMAIVIPVEVTETKNITVRWDKDGAVLHIQDLDGNEVQVPASNVRELRDALTAMNQW